jgi:hypothetical protein
MNSKFVTIIAGAVLIVFLLINYQTLFKSLVPPQPVVVSSHADDALASPIDYSMKVTTEVSNKGGDGDVVVKVKAQQGNHSWEKTKTVHIGSYQTEKVELFFDEVKLLEESPTYEVTTFALGSLKAAQ